MTHTEQPDFSFDIDPEGLVIYFGIRGQSYLYNGASGQFFAQLPDFAEDALRLLAARPGEAELATGLADIRARHGHPDVEPWLQSLLAIASGSDPSLRPEPRQTGFLKPMKPHLMNIYLAQGCNLGCSYCFNQRGTFGKKASFMTVETAQQVLEFVLGLARKGDLPEMGVNLFGGEPLLAPEAVYVLARGLMDHNLADTKTKVRIMLSTNGTIYRPEIFAIFKEDPRYATVVISLDGTKEAHDRNRPFLRVNRGSSYDVALENIRQIVADGVPHSVTCIVPSPFDFIGMAERLHTLGLERLEIKHLNYHIHGKEALPGVFDREYERWREQYIDYSEYHVDYMEGGGQTAHVDRFYKFKDFSRHLGGGTGFHKTLACGVSDDKIGIASDGTLFPCEAFLGHENFRFGHVTTGFDADKYRAFQERILDEGQHRVDHPKCKTCFAKKLCGGGCYAEAYDATSTFKKVDPESCRYIRETVKVDLHYLARANARNPERVARLMNNETGR